MIRLFAKILNAHKTHDDHNVNGVVLNRKEQEPPELKKKAAIDIYGYGYYCINKMRDIQSKTSRKKSLAPKIS